MIKIARKIIIYFTKLIRVLLYFDFQPLLFFWVLSDVFNNMVLWSNHSLWVEQGQGNTYFLYLAYLILSLLMLLSLHNYKRLSILINLYLCLYLFSTIRYLLYSVDYQNVEMIDYKNIFITIWYSMMWIWIAFKIKNENLHKQLKNE